MMSTSAAGSIFYREAIDLLQTARMPFLVGGAFAVREYTGIVRDTKDFDLFLRPAEVDDCLHTFRQAGFSADRVFPHWLAKVRRGELCIDLVYRAGNGLCAVDDAWFEFSREAEMFGTTIRLCPAEEMIWMKAYIMERERFDGADVAHLIRSCGAGLDWPRLSARFSTHWPVLFSHLVLFIFIYPDQRDVIPRSLLADFCNRLATLPDEPAAPANRCYGTLLSRAQYLADIERWSHLDARTLGPEALSREEIEFWTSAIGNDR